MYLEPIAAVAVAAAVSVSKSMIIVIISPLHFHFQSAFSATSRMWNRQRVHGRGLNYGF